MHVVIDRLAEGGTIASEELLAILQTDRYDSHLRDKADCVRQRYYGKDVYIRGLIEFSNYCQNDCLYCGIRRSNAKAIRYRLTREEILDCAREGYTLGFRTFVLQGGEDPYFTDDILCDIVQGIKEQFHDCAITLSMGERSRESYQRLRAVGVDRYLLRHETANEAHYHRLHPKSMSLSNRKECLFTLKELGYQVGAGFMVGSPTQTLENIVEDFAFLEKLQPAMIGIGPFLSHAQTPFAEEPNGELALSLRVLSLLRLCFPKVLLPSTTALGTLDSRGRELGLQHGGNVLMPNLSPVRVRKLYALYDNKICTGDETAQCRVCLEQRVRSVGYQIVTARGDSLMHS